MTKQNEKDRASARRLQLLPAPTWRFLRMNELALPDVPLQSAEELTQTFTKSTSEASAEKPFRVCLHYAGDVAEEKKLSFYIKEGAEATVILDASSAKETAGSLSVSTRIEADAGASFTLVVVSRFAGEANVLHRISAALSDNARMQLICLHLGERNFCGDCRVLLSGENSAFTSDVAYLLSESDKLTMNYVVEHRGKKSVSQLRTSGVLRGHAEKLFCGTIDFQNGCAGAKGDETEDVLLMDEDVVCRTIPVILCKEEDVVGNHGATIGRLDEKLLFYMQARGMSQEAVYETLARARLEAVINKIPDKETRERLLLPSSEASAAQGTNDTPAMQAT